MKAFVSKIHLLAYIPLVMNSYFRKSQKVVIAVADHMVTEAHVTLKELQDDIMYDKKLPVDERYRRALSLNSKYHLIEDYTKGTQTSKIGLITDANGQARFAIGYVGDNETGRRFEARDKSDIDTVEKLADKLDLVGSYQNNSYKVIRCIAKFGLAVE